MKTRNVQYYLYNSWLLIVTLKFFFEFSTHSLGHCQREEPSIHPFFTTYSSPGCSARLDKAKGAASIVYCVLNFSIVEFFFFLNWKHICFLPSYIFIQKIISKMGKPILPISQWFSIRYIQHREGNISTFILRGKIQKKRKVNKEVQVYLNKNVILVGTVYRFPCPGRFVPLATKLCKRFIWFAWKWMKMTHGNL